MHCLFSCYSIGSFMDEICGVQANDMDTQNLPTILPIDQLGHALTLLLSQSLHGVGIQSAFWALQEE
jgi:hypothetical protein